MEVFLPSCPWCGHLLNVNWEIGNPFWCSGKFPHLSYWRLGFNSLRIRIFKKKLCSMPTLEEDLIEKKFEKVIQKQTIWMKYILLFFSKKNIKDCRILFSFRLQYVGSHSHSNTNIISFNIFWFLKYVWLPRKPIFGNCPWKSYFGEIKLVSFSAH